MCSVVSSADDIFNNDEATQVTETNYMKQKELEDVCNLKKEEIEREEGEVSDVEGSEIVMKKTMQIPKSSERNISKVDNHRRFESMLNKYKSLQSSRVQDSNYKDTDIVKPGKAAKTFLNEFMNSDYSRAHLPQVMKRTQPGKRLHKKPRPYYLMDPRLAPQSTYPDFSPFESPIGFVNDFNYPLIYPNGMQTIPPFNGFQMPMHIPNPVVPLPLPSMRHFQVDRNLGYPFNHQMRHWETPLTQRLNLKRKKKKKAKTKTSAIPSKVVTSFDDVDLSDISDSQKEKVTNNEANTSLNANMIRTADMLSKLKTAESKLIMTRTAETKRVPTTSNNTSEVLTEDISAEEINSHLGDMPIEDAVSNNSNELDDLAALRSAVMNSMNTKKKLLETASINTHADKSCSNDTSSLPSEVQSEQSPKKDYNLSESGNQSSRSEYRFQWSINQFPKENIVLPSIGAVSETQKEEIQSDHELYQINGKYNESTQEVCINKTEIENQIQVQLELQLQKELQTHKKHPKLQAQKELQKEVQKQEQIQAKKEHQNQTILQKQEQIQAQKVLKKQKKLQKQRDLEMQKQLEMELRKEEKLRREKEKQEKDLRSASRREKELRKAKEMEISAKTIKSVIKDNIKQMDDIFVPSQKHPPENDVSSGKTVIQTIPELSEDSNSLIIESTELVKERPINNGRNTFTLESQIRSVNRQYKYLPRLSACTENVIFYMDSADSKKISTDDVILNAKKKLADAIAEMKQKIAKMEKKNSSSRESTNGLPLKEVQNLNFKIQKEKECLVEEESYIQELYERQRQQTEQLVEYEEAMKQLSQDRDHASNQCRLLNLQIASLEKELSTLRNSVSDSIVEL